MSYIIYYAPESYSKGGVWDIIGFSKSLDVAERKMNDFDSETYDLEARFQILDVFNERVRIYDWEKNIFIQKIMLMLWNGR